MNRVKTVPAGRCSSRCKRWAKPGGARLRRWAAYAARAALRAACAAARLPALHLSAGENLLY